MVSVGDPRRFRINLVPRDFVVAAISRLSALEVSGGRVYQLCDPHPSSVAELYDIFAKLTERRLIRFPCRTLWLGASSNTSRESDSGRGSHPNRSIISPIRPNTPARTRCGT